MTPSTWQHHVSQNHFQQINVFIWLAFNPFWKFSLKVQLVGLKTRNPSHEWFAAAVVEREIYPSKKTFLFGIFYSPFANDTTVCNLLLRDSHENCLRCSTDLFSSWRVKSFHCGFSVFFLARLRTRFSFNATFTYPQRRFVRDSIAPGKLKASIIAFNLVKNQYPWKDFPNYKRMKIQFD